MPSLRGTGDQTPCMSDNILLAAVRSSLELAFEPSAEVGHGSVGSGLVKSSGFRVTLCAPDSQPCWEDGTNEWSGHPGGFIFHFLI